MPSFRVPSQTGLRRATVPQSDSSHPAIAVNMDACIQCNLCVRACREVQVNDVIGFAGRGADAKIILILMMILARLAVWGVVNVFRALQVRSCRKQCLMTARNWLSHQTDRLIPVCPYCGVGCQITLHVKDEKIVSISGRKGPANQGRLCVKGRYGFDYIHHPDRLTTRSSDVRMYQSQQIWLLIRPIHLPISEASWEEALELATGFQRIKDRDGSAVLAGFGSAKGTNEEAYLIAEICVHSFWHKQC